ncbi:universal stress protein [Streptomyces halstedii]|uniref:universal stress protein n=1 Tax=Streptomyces halstedii TaxID=1944 RepID=UPI0036B2C0E4
MPATPFHRILTAWDASPAAHTALSIAMNIADGNGTVIALAVLTPPQHTETGGETSRDVTSQQQWLQTQFREALGTATSHGTRVRLEWSESVDIGKQLLECAALHGCDLIVIGRHGEDSRLRTSGIGPVAHEVCEGSDLPVLLVDATRSPRNSLAAP